MVWVFAQGAPFQGFTIILLIDVANAIHRMKKGLRHSFDSSYLSIFLHLRSFPDGRATDKILHAVAEIW